MYRDFETVAGAVIVPRVAGRKSRTHPCPSGAVCAARCQMGADACGCQKWGSRIPVCLRAKQLSVGTGEYANVHFQTTRSCSSLDAADRRSEDTQAEGTYRRAISLSRSSGNSATGGRSHPLFILRTNQIGGSSLAGIESPRSAMLNVRLGEQTQVERAIRRDFAASPTQVATSAQCHTLDGTGK